VTTPAPSASPLTPLHTLSGHTESLSVALSPDGKQVVSGGTDGMFKIWDLGTANLVRSVDVGGDTWVKAIFAPDGMSVLSANRSSKTNALLKTWDANSGRLLRTIGGFPESLGCDGLLFLKDGRLLLVGDDGMLRILRLPSSAPTRTIKPPVAYRVEQVAISPDERTILISADIHGPRLYEFTSGKLIRSLEGVDEWTTDEKLGMHSSDHKVVNTAYSVALSPDGARALAGFHDGTIAIWQAASGTLAGRWSVPPGGTLTGDQSGYRDSALAVTWSPDGKGVLSGSRSGMVQLWDAGSGKLVRSFEGHKDIVTCVVFTADGRYAISGSFDKTIKIWDVTGL
jgi:WD40 repeat protein